MAACAFYLLLHIPRTGGTSLVADVARFGLRACEAKSRQSEHRGADVYSRYRDIARVGRAIGGANAQACRCNFFMGRGHLDDALVPLHHHAIHPSLILLLRDPVYHVLSMHSHCRSEVQNYTETLSQWLSLPYRGESGRSLCRYDPANYQSTRLGGVTRGERAIRSAWAVGVLEQYDSFLDLLLWKSGAVPVVDVGTVKRAERRTAPSSELETIRLLTREDAHLHSVARRRFVRDHSAFVGILMHAA